MRKLHDDMIHALLKGKSAKRANDWVALYNGQPDDARRVWFYHENDIAYVNSRGEVRVSLAGWGTASTRARLNALCSVVAPHLSFYQHKGDQYLCYTGTDEHGNRWHMPEKLDDLEKTILVGKVPEARNE